MAKTTKTKINDKTLDVLQKTKKQPSAKSGSSSKKVEETISRASRSRSRSMSRTPARPPPAKTKKPSKKKSQTPNSSETDDEMIVVGPPKIGRPSTKKKEEKEPKPKAPRKKAAPKKTEPKRVGKEPTTKPKRRAHTPPPRKARATPTRQSKRISTIYNANPSNSMDTLDSPKGSNHILSNNKDVDTQSISSTSSSSSRKGWFSNCVIV